jgi:hypothetical protein
MRIIEVEINCKGRSDRVELFPFFDLHIGKANCNEGAIRKQVQEVLRREKMPGRHIRVLLGGDAVNSVSPSDRKRFDFSDIADWLVKGSAEEIKDALADLPNREIKRAESLLGPIKHLIVGALEGNHEKALRKYHNMDVQERLCEKLGCLNLSDEALIRFRFKRPSGKKVATSTAVVYLRHGYGAGRKAGAEPSKLYDMLAEWECADICFSGHSHSFCVLPPKAVGFLPMRGELPEGLIWKHRFAANPGCWLDSHSIGRGSYESGACYPARAFMTCKAVIWPFYTQTTNGQDFNSPKIELRSYPIL